MPWGIAASVAGPVIGSVVSSAMAPSTSGGSGGGGPSYYVPTGLSTADQQWQALQQGNINAYNANNLAQYGLSSLQGGVNAANQYAPGYQGAANQAGQQYGNLASQAQGLSGTVGNQISNAQNAQNYLQGIGQYGLSQAAPQQNYLQGLGQAAYVGAQLAQPTLQQAGLQTYGLSQSQNNPLYQQSVANLTDQVNAQEALRGLGTSAVGGAETNQALQQFNNQWNQQQIQNAQAGLQGLTGAFGAANQIGNTGLQGALGAYGAANNIGNTAVGNLNALYGTSGTYGNQIGALAGQQLGLGAQGAGYQLQAGQLPYSTAQSIAATPGALANTYGQFLNQNVYGPAQSIQQMAIPYMNYGQGAQAMPFQSQAQGAGALGSMVSQGISGLANNPSVSNWLGSTFGGGSSYGAQNALGFGSGGSMTAPYYSGGGMNSSYGFTM